MIKEVLDEGGQYVFFIKKAYGKKLINSRIEKAHEALKYANKLYKKHYLNEQVRVLEGNQITEWINEYVNVVITVQYYCGITKPVGLKNIEEWSEYEEYQNIKFIHNQTLDSFITQIQNELKKEKAIIRVIGHSGLGKSRLVLQALMSQGLLKNNAVYYSAIHVNQDIINFIRSHVTSMKGVFIVDNCDYNTYLELRNEIKRISSGIKLITIDYNVEEEYDPSLRIGTVNYIFLKSEHYIPIIPELISNLLGGVLSKTEIDHIARYSEGYPKMAVLFAEAASRGLSPFSDFFNEDLKAKLLFGRDYDKSQITTTRYEIIKACSIFSFFGTPFFNDLEILSDKDKEFLEKQNVTIYNQICSPPYTSKLFKETCDYFIKKQILEKRGRFLSVRPTILAIKLAIEWWKYRAADDFRNLFPIIESNGLAEPLVERLNNLDQLTEAKEIVNDLWGPKKPFWFCGSA